jgi:hypothetical protein
MAKKKRKKKNRHEEEAAASPIVAHEKEAAISATALQSFNRDLATFGSRADKQGSVGQKPLV